MNSKEEQVVRVAVTFTDPIEAENLCALPEPYRFIAEWRGRFGPFIQDSRNPDGNPLTVREALDCGILVALDGRLSPGDFLVRSTT